VSVRHITGQEHPPGQARSTVAVIVVVVIMMVRLDGQKTEEGARTQIVRFSVHASYSASQMTNTS
jgi:hypothetical protein